MAVMCEAAVLPRPALSDLLPQESMRQATGWAVALRRVKAMCLVELQKLKHEHVEIYTRALQPVLWLVIFGETVSRLHAIPTGKIPYLDYLVPGVMAQAAMFIAILYGIMIIYERDSGTLSKLLVTPTPRAALVTGKAFAAGVKAAIQAVVVLITAAFLGVRLSWSPFSVVGMLAAVILASGFFACLAMSIAGIALKRNRQLAIGQVITMPLFFCSNALYPVRLMPGWVQAVSRANPLSYQVDALRTLLLGVPVNL